MDSLCSHCNEGHIILDAESYTHVCSSCGLEHSSDLFRSQSFAADGRPEGSLIYSVGDFNYRERKIYRAKTLISDLTSRLGLSSSRAAETLTLISDITNSSFGSGDWFPVLIAAASYVIMRRHRLPPSIPEAAAAVGCDEYQIGRMVSRIVNFLELGQLPEFDTVQALDRAVRTCPSFAGLDEKKVEEVIVLGRFLLQCAMKWFLMTGRRPLPAVAAVVAFVAEVNGVEVGVEEIAKEIYAGVSTSRVRLKELKETLVRVARDLLPWGKDVNFNFKNLVHNAPLLIRVMELKSKAKSKSEGLEGFELNLDEILNVYSNYEEEEDSKYFKVLRNDEGSKGMSCIDLGSIIISEECLSRAYKNVLDRIARFQDEGGLGNDNGKKKKKRRGLETEALKDSWEGRWDTDKKLTLEQVLQRDVGYDALPPSFVSGLESRRRRRVKIEAAKHRINETMKPLSATESGLAVKEEDCLLKPLVARKRRRRGVGIEGIDWEDCIIELLLLHPVDEDEIEQGQYNRLLDLHVFNYLGTER